MHVFFKAPRQQRLTAILLASAFTMLAGCDDDSGNNAGGGGGGAPVVIIDPTPTPTPTPDPVTPTDPGQIIAQFLSIDLDNLLNYANPALPAYYDNTVFNDDNEPNNNQADDRIATLGRVLFYDQQLSVNNSISCASCHQQGLGFDDDEQFSAGFAGNEFTGAHAMRLGNIRFYRPNDMFWDKRSNSVEDQAAQPIRNAVEMGWDQDAGGIPALITKMQALEYYPVLFDLAFGDEGITEDRMQRALANFERAMISDDSRWDRAYAQVFNANAPNRNLEITLPGFTASEELGRRLFINDRNDGGVGCAACHQPPSFALTANSRSNGLDAGETTEFKSPSLKNVGRSQFFMHDGRFTSLAQVVDHYNSGIQDGPALDNRLRRGNGPQRLNLSQTDRQALVDFMLSLNDETLSVDQRFTDPFLQ